MTIRVGISGLGRIGRLVFRLMEADPRIEVAAINYPGDAATLAHLLKYDSVHGRGFDTVVAEGDTLLVDDRAVTVLRERDPAALTWGALGIDLVVESTGLFNDATKAAAHIKAGARKVLITAPAKNEDCTVVLGVNEGVYDPNKHHIVSNASCTTNCLAPVAKVLLDSFGVRRGFMNTIHAYTNDQRMVDRTHKDLRRARAAALSMIPTTTGAARAVALVLPALKGKLDGIATRVPTPDGSLVDLTVELERDTTVEEVNAAMKAAADGPMKGILEYTADPIVSCDVIGNEHSSVFDSGLTMVLGDNSNLVKLFSWYDNELGYSARVRDLALLMLA
ncbi:MAG: type I glyceraldehyde-3-phosphate dehydrogenase [Coriobacteriales bacterium]|nr:type I glyceraldehyde-3-phosphate dehydrogenase [Coriobacteriales bacterium]